MISKRNMLFIVLKVSYESGVPNVEICHGTKTEIRNGIVRKRAGSLKMTQQLSDHRNFNNS